MPASQRWRRGQSLSSPAPGAEESDPVTAISQPCRYRKPNTPSRSVGTCSLWVVAVCEMQRHGREWTVNQDGRSCIETANETRAASLQAALYNVGPAVLVVRSSGPAGLSDEPDCHVARRCQHDRRYGYLLSGRSPRDPGAEQRG